MIKVVVLYPQPADPDAFERQYVGQHLPLMRQLVGPDTPIPTFRLQNRPDRPSPWYSMAEIHFRDQAELDDFVRSGRAATGAKSSEAVSTGGKPLVFIGEPRAPI